MLMRRMLTATVFLGFSLSNCTPALEGEYSDPKTVDILNDKWNETDARVTGERLVESALKKAWLEEFKRSKGQKPVVIVDEVENRCDEHIDTKAITESIQNELINSGKIRFVDKDKRQQILEEIKFQQSGAVSAKSAKKTGNQTGADFMMSGAISNIVQTQENKKVVTYQVIMKLTNIETGEIEWTDKYDIKKRFKKSGVGF